MSNFNNKTDFRLGNNVLGIFLDEKWDEEKEDFVDVQRSTVCVVTELLMDPVSFEDSIVVECDINVDQFDNFEGIRLNDEWLKKLGFSNKGKQISEHITIHEWHRENFGFVLSPNTKMEYAVLTMNRSHLITMVDSVHHLQNLYFAITGKELNQIEIC